MTAVLFNIVVAGLAAGVYAAAAFWEYKTKHPALALLNLLLCLTMLAFLAGYVAVSTPLPDVRPPTPRYFRGLFPLSALGPAVVVWIHTLRPLSPLKGQGQPWTPRS